MLISSRSPTSPRGECRAHLARLASRPGAEVTIRPARVLGGERSVVRGSAPGDPQGDLVKPEVTAPGVGVLGAYSPVGRVLDPVNLFSGTSAATARVSGQAAVTLARHRDWSPARVQSALMTSASTRTVVAEWARVGPSYPARNPGLAYDVDTGDYRCYLSGRLDGRDLTGQGPAVIRCTSPTSGHAPWDHSVRTRGFTS